MSGRRRSCAGGSRKGKARSGSKSPTWEDILPLARKVQRCVGWCKAKDQKDCPPEYDAKIRRAYVARNGQEALDGLAALVARCWEKPEEAKP